MYGIGDQKRIKAYKQGITDPKGYESAYKKLVVKHVKIIQNVKV